MGLAAYHFFLAAGPSEKSRKHLFGGRAIREVTKTDLVLSEMAGIFVAIVCLGLGALAKSAGEEDVSEEEGQSS